MPARAGREHAPSVIPAGAEQQHPEPPPLVWPALVVALVLAALTGFVDAVAFERVLGVFPANQSGNAVFLGVAIGGDQGATGWLSGVAMAAFVVGVALGQLTRRRIRGPRVAAVLLACELVLLGAAIAVMGPVEGVHLIGGAEGALLVVLLSAAMGVQTTVIRHVAGTAVATTYQTGAIDRMGEAVSRVVVRDGRLRDERGVAVLLLVLVAYVGGAAVGASPVGEWRWALALAAATVAVVALGCCAAPGRLARDGG
jgi:uncharacterized membrane protein YoaK (UPF0700 family)